MKVAIKVVKKGLKDVLTFGRYKGRTVEELIEEDPDYLTWVHTHVDFFPLEQDVMDQAIEAAVNQPRNEEPDWYWMLDDDPPY